MLKVLSSMAPREVLAKAAALYAVRKSVEVITIAAGGVDVAKRIAAGEAFDIAVLAVDAMAKLLETGRLSADGPKDLMTSGIAIAVRSGDPIPDVATEAALRNAVLQAASLSYSTGPSGTYLEKLFARWQILSIIADRIVIPPPGVPVARLIAGGEAALGFQQMSELIDTPGIDLVGMMPESLQLITTFTSAVAFDCADPGTAQDFIEFVSSPATDHIKQRYGMSATR